MPDTVEFDLDPTLPPQIQAGESLHGLPEEEDEAAMLVVYQQIADRRAQLENADVLRRARSL